MVPTVSHCLMICSLNHINHITYVRFKINKEWKNCLYPLTSLTTITMMSLHLTFKDWWQCCLQLPNKLAITDIADTTQSGSNWIYISKMRVVSECSCLNKSKGLYKCSLNCYCYLHNDLTLSGESSNNTWNLFTWKVFWSFIKVINSIIMIIH